MDKVKPLASVALAATVLASAAAGALAQDAETGPELEAVSGSYRYVRMEDGGESIQKGDGHRRLVDATWLFRSHGIRDPRLVGSVLFTTTTEYLPGLTYFYRVGRLETADGIWQQEPVLTISEDPVLGDTIDTIWVGKEAHAGLLLVAEWTWTGDGFDIEGHIVDSDLLPTPTAISPTDR